jgi:hypothetical protein
MAYSLAICLPPIPDDDLEAWEHLRESARVPGPQAPVLAELEARITARFPATGADRSPGRDDEGAVSDGLVVAWYGARAAELELADHRLGEVFAYVVFAAHELDLPVFDPAGPAIYRPPSGRRDYAAQVGLMARLCILLGGLFAVAMWIPWLVIRLWSLFQSDPRSSTDAGTVWFGVGLLTTVVAIPVSLALAWRRLRLSRCGHWTYARPVEISAIRPSGSGPVTFTYEVTGRLYTHRKDVTDDVASKYHESTLVPVVYDPARPTRCHVLSDISTSGTVLVVDDTVPPVPSRLRPHGFVLAAVTMVVLLAATFIRWYQRDHRPSVPPPSLPPGFTMPRVPPNPFGVQPATAPGGGVATVSVAPVTGVWVYNGPAGPLSGSVLDFQANGGGTATFLVATGGARSRVEYDLNWRQTGSNVTVFVMSAGGSAPAPPVRLLSCTLAEDGLTLRDREARTFRRRE